MAASTKTTRDLVATVLADKRAAALGDPDAAARLAAAARGRATTPTTVPPPPTPPAPPPPVGLVASAQMILRPNGEIYHVRKMGIHDDVAMMQQARRDNIPVLLYGIPGCGKTALFEAAFADGFEFVPGDGDTQVSAFTGGYVPMPGGGFRWIDGPLVRAMERGVPMLVDEVALIEPQVMAVVYSVMDGRSILRVADNPERDDIHSQPGFAVFGACNPNAPGARMSDALLSRFKLHVEMGVDFQLMRKMGVNPKLITCVQNMKKKLETTHDISWYPAIREMLSFTEIERVFGLPVALANVVSQAPEMDRHNIQDLLTRGFSDILTKPITTLEIR